jgi:hypothetical protein
MNDRSKTIINNSSTITYGSIGAGAAVGAGASVVQQGTLPPELMAAMNSGLNELSAAVAELAHAQKLDQRRIDFLAEDLKRIKKSLDTPNEQEFQSAAASLISKVNMVSDGVQSASRLASGIAGLAKAFGWAIAL